MKTLALIAAMAWCCVANAAETVDGKQAFKARCAKCHGEGGTGTFMLSRKLGKEKGQLESRTDLVPEFVRHVVRNGIVSMPAITRVEVTDDELRAITQYLSQSIATRPR